MKLYLLITLTVFTNILKADILFPVFRNHYKIESRWCQSEDVVCESLEEIAVGVDTKTQISFIIEFYQDGRNQRIDLWAGAKGSEQAFITGNHNYSAVWSHINNANNLIEGCSVYRTNPGAPIYYNHEEQSPHKIIRKYQIVPIF